MRIATYNVNGVNGRLPVLLRWLKETTPDVVVLQELKAPQEKFPEKAIRDLGYDVIWHGQKSWNGVAMLSRVGEIHETRRGLPDDPDPAQSRYIEAAVNGILIGGLYMPNGNPRPGSKFDYKLRWFVRLIEHAAGLLDSGLPVMLLGDFNVMPTDRDVYKPERWLDDALFAPEVRELFFRLTGQGWTDALRAIHPDETIYTFWDYFRNAYGRNAGLRIDHLLLSPALADRLVDAQVDVLRPTKDRTLYFLVYATRRLPGIEVFRDCHVRSLLEQSEMRGRRKLEGAQKRSGQMELLASTNEMGPDRASISLPNEERLARELLLDLAPDSGLPIRWDAVWPEVLSRRVVRLKDLKRVANDLRKEGALVFPGWPSAAKRTPEDEYLMLRGTASFGQASFI